MAEVDKRKDLLTRTSAKFHKGIDKIIAEKIPGLPKKIDQATTKTTDRYYKIIEKMGKGVKESIKEKEKKDTINQIVARWIKRHGFDALYPPQYSFGLDKNFKMRKTTPEDQERLQVQMDEKYKEEMKKLKEQFWQEYKAQYKKGIPIRAPKKIKDEMKAQMKEEAEGERRSVRDDLNDKKRIKALEKIKDEAKRLREIYSTVH